MTPGNCYGKSQKLKSKLKTASFVTWRISTGDIVFVINTRHLKPAAQLVESLELWKKKFKMFCSKPKIIFCLWRCCVRHAEQSVIWSLVRIKTRQCQQNSNGYWVVKQLLPIFHFVYKTGKLTTAPKRVPKHKIWKLQSKSYFSIFTLSLY